MFRATGKNAAKVFNHESGGHRWQRVPPTEKKGRRQTSTITVAVLEEPREFEFSLDMSEVEETFMRGSGPGGQHRNKIESAVRLKHVPTGITVRIENDKSQHKNRAIAKTLLASKVMAQERSKGNAALNDVRKEQVGSGMRGDKVRTIQVHNNTVTNHSNDKRITYKEYCKGNLTELF